MTPKTTSKGSQNSTQMGAKRVPKRAKRRSKWPPRKWSKTTIKNHPKIIKNGPRVPPRRRSTKSLKIDQNHQKKYPKRSQNDPKTTLKRTSKITSK